MTYFKTKTIWFWAFIVLLILNISAVSTMFYHGKTMRQRHPDYKFREMTKKNPREYMTKRLNLNEDQSKLFKVIHNEHKEYVTDLKKQISEMELKLFKLSANHSDSSTIEDELIKISQLKMDLTKESLKVYKDLRAVCTPEQHEEFDKMFTKFVTIRSQSGPKGPGVRRRMNNDNGRHRGRYRNNQ